MWQHDIYIYIYMYIFRAQGVSHVPTLGPKYRLYSYMDPLGKAAGS